MPSDNLFALLAAIKRDCPEVPDEAWEKIKRMLGDAAGGERVYVPAQKKRAHLEVIAAAGDTASAAQLSKMLGVSVRRAQQLKRLR